MFSVYPSNKLEHLSALLNGLLQAQPLPPLQQETILVESPGMQHWLHLNLAEQNGISMNLDFPLTSRFVWDVARAVLGKDSIPKHSMYRREVLRFRILNLFNNKTFMQKAVFAPVTQFWQAQFGQSNTDQALQASRKLSLAIEVADAFEQYLLFRPNWLMQWENNTLPQEMDDKITGRWQAELWRKLVEEQPWHPANLLQETTRRLNGKAEDALSFSAFPSRILVFAVNAIAPSLLDFFNSFAKHCDIHFFYLNPSVSYWGDMKSDTQTAFAMRRAQFQQSLELEQPNRLLANLGQHGRDLLNRLAEMETFEVSAFDSPVIEQKPIPLCLQQLQQGIYSGVATNTEANNEDAINTDIASAENDESIRIVSCHTALREVQVLHDYLLHKLASNKQLSARDIIVLCPAIEDYAPYVHSVFAKPGETVTNKLTCSISDRNLLSTDPHVIAFMSLLALPDSRFSVSSVLTFLDNPDIANQFNLDEQSIELIAMWLNEAAVRWGLNAEHKQSVANIEQASEQNSWEWGLQRLIVGISSRDSADIIDGMLTIPDVEGSNTLVLGNLLRFLLFLQRTKERLSQQHTLADWTGILDEFCKHLFEKDGVENGASQAGGIHAIKRALFDLQMHTQQANFEHAMTFSEVKELLTMAFASPDVRNQFLTGHVTFCSMMPMRSVPFNTVAVLGLNDGQFPRKAQQQSINIISMLSPESGDRSRAKEDRYLFLEAILSARESLYLSYQGVSAKDNTERQPSTVLRLFQQELGKINQQAATAIHYPLHHFSVKNYQAPLRSANAGGYRLVQGIIGQKTALDTPHCLLAEQNLPALATTKGMHWNIATMALCFQNPLAFLANQRLGVSFGKEQHSYEDDEPFDTDPLVQYQTLDNAMGAGQKPEFDEVIQRVRLSGTMPDTVIAEQVYQTWEGAIKRLSEALPPEIESTASCEYSAQVNGFIIGAEARRVGENIVDFHIGAQSAKRKVAQWLRHLVVNAQEEAPLTSHTYYIDWKKSEQKGEQKEEQKGAIICSVLKGLSKQESQEYLAAFVNAFLNCLNQPMLLHARLGEAMCRAKTNPENTWKTHFEGTQHMEGLYQDPYFKWLMPSVPLWQDWETSIRELYQPMVTAMKNMTVKHD